MERITWSFRRSTCKTAQKGREHSPGLFKHPLQRFKLSNHSLPRTELVTSLSQLVPSLQLIASAWSRSSPPASGRDEQQRAGVADALRSHGGARRIDSRITLETMVAASKLNGRVQHGIGILMFISSIYSYKYTDTHTHVSTHTHGAIAMHL